MSYPCLRIIGILGLVAFFTEKVWLIRSIESDNHFKIKSLVLNFVLIIGIAYQGKWATSSSKIWADHPRGLGWRDLYWPECLSGWAKPAWSVACLWSLHHSRCSVPFCVLCGFFVPFSVPFFCYKFCSKFLCHNFFI